MYTDREMKFSGKMYDILEQKLLIFKDCAERTGISQPDFAQALPTCLGAQRSSSTTITSETLQGTPRDFHSLVARIKRHFETEESQQTIAMHLVDSHPRRVAVDELEKATALSKGDLDVGNLSESLEERPELILGDVNHQGQRRRQSCCWDP